MKKKNTGFKILVTIFSIGLTFTLINKFNVIEKIEKVEVIMQDDKQKSTPAQDLPASESTVAPSTPKPTEKPTEAPTPTPVIISATPEIDDKKEPEKRNRKKLEPDTETTDDTETNETSETSNNATKEPNNSEENSDVQNNSNDEENTESTSNVQCKLNINSSGRLVMETGDEVSESDATVNISSDSETEDGRTYLSYNYSDLLNPENNYDDEPTSYISVVPGVYIVNFVNCDFNNVNFYLDTITEEPEDDEESDEPIHISADNYKSIPSQDIVDVEIAPNSSTTYISVVADQSFSALIKFYSKSGNEINANLRILDDKKDELESFGLMKNKDNKVAGFSFEEGKEYYLEINTDQNEETVQETLCLQIMNNEE